MSNFFFGNKYIKTKIDTPYKNISTESLLAKFQTEEWSRMDQDARINTFQELENRYAIEQKRPVARIVAEENYSRYGSYSSGGENNRDTIRIQMTDSAKNNSYEQLDSYYHESRHAYQSQAVQNGAGLDRMTLNMCTVEDTPGNYVSSGLNYDMQTCEMDSNNVAATKMLEHCDKFGSDPEYQNYLERRQEHFQNVNKLCENEKYYRADRQLELTKKSQENGDISKKQASQIREHIEKGEIDSVVSDSRLVENKIRLQNAELKRCDEDVFAEQRSYFSNHMMKHNNNEFHGENARFRRLDNAEEVDNSKMKQKVQHEFRHFMEGNARNATPDELHTNERTSSSERIESNNQML